MSTDYDPRDDTDIRPHVEFHLTEGAIDTHELFAALGKRVQEYHDMSSRTHRMVRFVDTYDSAGRRTRSSSMTWPPGFNLSHLSSR